MRAEPVRGFLERHALGEALHRGLRGAVDRPARVGMLRRARGDVHEDPLAAALPQLAHEGLAAVEDAQHVHLEVQARRAGLDLPERGDRLQHARVVHPELDRAEARLDAGSEGRDGRRVAYVEPRRDHVLAVGQDRRAPGAETEAEAPLGEGAREARAEPAARARDHGGLAREVHPGVGV